MIRSNIIALSLLGELRRVASDAALRGRLQARGSARALEMFDIAAVTATLDAARARLLAAR